VSSHGARSSRRRCPSPSRHGDEDSQHRDDLVGAMAFLTSDAEPD
jgi:hypothetical protein